MNNVDLSLGVTGVNTGVQQNKVAQAANTNVGVVTQPNTNVNQQISNTQVVFTPKYDINGTFEDLVVAK